MKEEEKSLCEEETSSESDVLDIASSTDKIQKIVRDFKVQISMDKITTLSVLLNLESALKSFTGINNFQILNCLEERTRKVLHSTRSHRLAIKERIILTMTKLKLDLSYVTLATLFDISGQLCKTYFFDMLLLLSEVLKPAIYFPSSEEISKNIPKCFKNFSTCKAGLDCVEIFVQKPSCFYCRMKFYSHYKGNTTVKFMTSVSPADMITFISKSYGERASDKLIFQESNFISKLCPNKDSIMVDKGFLIYDICALYKIKLIRLPFLRKKTQLSPEEAVFNQQIAAARPNRLYSPHTTILRQSGNSFEIANSLCSLLIGLGYDAYVISGYAIQDVTLKIMVRINSPFPPEEEEKEEEVKVKTEGKYVLKPPKDLRSQFLLYMKQREIDKILQAEEEAKEAEEMRIAELEKPPFDELYGQRIHAWVLLLEGMKGVEETVFIEASTGYFYQLDSWFYCGIESIWNNENYWVNLQDCSQGLDKIDYDFSNVENWEHFIIGEPAKWRDRVISDEMDENDIKLLLIEEEKHLDIPNPWSLPIYLSHQAISDRFPNGVKKTWYKRTMVEEFAPYIQEDGLVTRICRYHDLDCSPSELYVIEERYSNRVDNLVKIISDCNTGEITEYFRRGREDGAKRHIYKSGKNASVECERVIEFYDQARYDGLKKLEFDELFIIEHYVNPENLVYHRHSMYAPRGHPPPGILEGTRRIVTKIIEKRNRDETRPPSDDIAIIEFALVEREIHIKYHYEEGKVTASTRDFIKPPLAEMGDDLKFNPNLTVGYQSEVGAKPPSQLVLFRFLEQLLREEDETLYHIREMEDAALDFLKLRNFEIAFPKLSISLFDRVHNTEHRKGMLEREQKEKEYREREVEDEIDCLSPYICRLGGPLVLTKAQAMQAREWCMTEFKQMLVNRANDIQRQFEEESAALVANQNWYITVQDTLKPNEETEYYNKVNNSMFLLHTLEMRLIRHRDLSPYRYEALDNYLKMDPRLSIMYTK